MAAGQPSAIDRPPAPVQPLRRLALVTDAWHPQTNGVVNTLSHLVRYLDSVAVDVLVVSPEGHLTVPMPLYDEIRITCDPWNGIRRIREYQPEAVHVATEGPLGVSVRLWMGQRGLKFTTSFHTRFPEYITARLPVPLEWGYRAERWFHSRATHTMVGSLSMMRELQRRRVGNQLVHWPRGVDDRLFHPSKRRSDVYEYPRPVWLYVGRVAIEKSLDDFLCLSLPGTKVVVGDGPAREQLQRRFSDVVWRGWRLGEDLAAHFASADCFVFPSRTETFGNVVLEAMASGLPVAAVPAPGPVDLILDGRNGALSEALGRACVRALACSREAARETALRYRWSVSHDLFCRYLVPIDGAGHFSCSNKDSPVRMSVPSRT
jgi:glycosyltransferase involved in cell wall biosynthesis